MSLVDRSETTKGSLLKLILVRHGETFWNQGHRIQGGDSDIELNEKGMQQARRLAAFLKNEPVAVVLSSPLRRAVSTAEIIAKRHHLPVDIDQRLRELKVGELEGMSYSNLRTTFSQFLMQWWQDGGAVKLPGGESLVELQERAWNVIENLRAKHNTGAAASKETTALVVSHYFVTLVIILKALDFPLKSFTRFRLDLGGVSILEFRDFGARLLTFNDTSY
jgi:broad specificity phosphatase PhoE